MKEIFDFVEEKMGKTMKALDHEFTAIRAGRANPNVLDKVMVDYYGTPTAINALAAISVSEARTLVIQPWDASVLKAVEKAIQKADVGINPNNDGRVIRLSFPPLTEERRKELTRDVAKMGEDAKIAVRSIRRDGIDKLKAKKKSNEITEDDLKNGEKKLQDITDKFVKEIETMTAGKEKEIMEI